MENGFGDFHVRHHHGWQQVTNVKKQRRLESKDAKKVGKAGNAALEKRASGGQAVAGSDLTVFSALDEASEQRRVRLAAAKQAGIDDAAEFDNDEEPENEEAEVLVNGADGEHDKRPKPKKQKKPKVTPADAAAGMDAADLSSFLAQISDSFAELPDVQLMRCADYFARSFSAVTTAHFSFQKILRDSAVSKSVEVPLCYVPESVSSTAGEWLSKQPAEELGRFAILLLKGVLEDAPKKGSSASIAPSKAKVGILVVLAILMRKRPDVMLQQAEVLRTSPEFQGQEKLPTLAWAYGQVAQADLISGMWLWVRNLLPLAVGKQSNPLTRDLALTFFESLVCKNLAKARATLVNGASKKGERLVTPAALNSLLHAAFPLEGARTKATDRFAAAYPLVKEVALAGSYRSKTSKPAALQMLPLSLAAAGEEPPTLSEEACSIFAWCLSQNPDCYKQWEKHHTEQLGSSSRVLSYMLHNWKALQGRLTPWDALRRTLNAFRRKHRELLREGGGDPEQERAVKKADGMCKALLGKLSSFPSCLKATATLVAVAAMGYGFYRLSPSENPWGWDGYLLLSRTHPLI